MEIEYAQPEAPIAWRRALVWVRRLLAAGVLLLGIAYLALPLWVDAIAGASDWEVLEGKNLSPEAEAFVEVHLRGLGTGPLIDVHAHLAGRGVGSECWVHPDMLSRWHPGSWVRFQSYLSAGGISGEQPDSVFAENLIRLTEAMPIPVRTHFLGFDFAHDASGAVDEDGSAFHVPDEHVIQFAEQGGHAFHPLPSIHPSAPDAIERVQAAAAAGARLIKWLPAAQNIDPASPAYDDFYAAVKAADITLLVHCGSEHAVETGHAHGLGNPLRLRHPLDQGVRILVAHCATTGKGVDLDAKGGEAPKVANHKLFLRLMDERKYEGLLFGDISTLTQVNHYKHGLADLLARTDLHHRLINGSDWPLPAINILIHLGPLARAGFLVTDSETEPDPRPVLKEIYEYNPLLFDLVLKRAIRHPETGARFADSVFLASAHPLF